jgi:hypothetical protein
MKRWALLTVFLYAVILILFTIPLLLFFGLKWPLGSRSGAGWEWSLSPAEAMAMYRQWGYWVWLLVLVGAQLVLLLVPLGAAERRLKPRRPLFLPIVTAAFLLANLLFSGMLAIACGIFGDDTSKPLEFLAELAGTALGRVPLLGNATDVVGPPGGERLVLLVVVGLIVLLWLIWALLFYEFGRADEPAALGRRLTRWLLRGSILELLVAVPSHIAVRSREECCAPVGSFWGIVCGFSVMLLAFGPGAFFLYAERCRRLRPGAGSSPSQPSRADAVERDSTRPR